jgi:hypothetical protein
VQAGSGEIRVIGALLQAVSDREVEEAGSSTKEEDDCEERALEFAGLVVL